jgi:hypothetical protein
VLQEIGAVPKTLDTLGVVYPDLPRTEHSKADEKPRHDDRGHRPSSASAGCAGNPAIGAHAHRTG